MVQEKQFTAVGSNRLQHADTRIIAATNVDLEANLSAGRFREDLYYRLNVINVHTPPLRERQGDIAQLADHFLQACSRQYKKDIRGFTAAAAQALQQYRWPGNIRELRNILIRAVILCQDHWIDLPQLELPEYSRRQDDTPAITNAGAAAKPIEVEEVVNLEELESGLQAAFAEQVRLCLAQGLRPPLGSWLEEDLILASLELHGQVNLQAAEALAIPESTLRRKLARYSTASPREAKLGADWQAVTRALPSWIKAALRAHINPLRHLHQLLLGQISQQSRTQTEAAALVGVSPPTYRRQISQLALR